MPEHEALPYLREIILFLVLAGVLIPLLARLRVNPVLGFLAVGTVVGPYGLGAAANEHPWLGWLTFGSQEDVAAFAELGVVFLMFTIGLEMSVERLWAMRRLVFGAGGAQVGLSALAIGGIALAFGNEPEAAVVLGLVLALSSTAVVMQLLAQRREMSTPMGRVAFAVLLFQDLAVVPLLVLIAILGQEGKGSFFSLLGLATLKAVVTVGLIYLAGSRLIRPLFHHLAGRRAPDTFMALTLLASLGVAALTWAAGLSMAMGALLAGLIIAETEFRHEVEVTIEPFKGLLMGLFFLSVGMGIDLAAFAQEPLWLPLSVLGLMLLKGLILFGVLRVAGLTWGRATEGAVLLSQGGEFAFIVVGTAMQLDLLPPGIGQFMLLVVGLSMLATPFAAKAGQWLGETLDRRLGSREQVRDDALVAELTDHVIIAGYGRVGQLVGQLLLERGLSMVAVEPDARQVVRHRRKGVPVIFGDASRPGLLRRLHLERATLVILTMNDAEPARNAVGAIRALAPKVPILARVQDERHALELLQAGANGVIPDTLEAALQLAGLALESLGEGEEAIHELLHEERKRRIGAYQEV
ncbi:MAG: cation:proton antiporter [Rhodocyclaceae bacterium]|jgi:CPA2 family monovalent cation:H+ antiporter-2|nr:cation:proton antiporter [Rhodocyclaceae bacterium]